MHDLESLARPLAAELRARWPLEGAGLEDWIARALALGAAAGQEAAVGHRCATVAGLLEDFRRAQRDGEAEADS